MPIDKTTVRISSPVMYYTLQAWVSEWDAEYERPGFPPQEVMVTYDEYQKLKEYLKYTLRGEEERPARTSKTSTEEPAAGPKNDVVEQSYRQHCLSRITSTIADGENGVPLPYVSTSALSFLADAMELWESTGRTIADLVEVINHQVGKAE